MAQADGFSCTRISKGERERGNAIQWVFYFRGSPVCFAIKGVRGLRTILFELLSRDTPEKCVVGKVGNQESPRSDNKRVEKGFVKMGQVIFAAVRVIQKECGHG